MEEISTLKDLYSFLDTCHGEFLDLIILSSKLHAVHESIMATGAFGDAEKVMWEIDALCLSVSDCGELSPFMRAYDEDGNLVENANADNINDYELSYFVRRMETTLNPLIKARYAHILWNSPKKHGNYAKIAIREYMKLSKIYEHKDIQNPAGQTGHGIITCMKAAHTIAQNAKISNSDIRSEIFRLISSFNPNSSSRYKVVFDLINIGVNDRKLFSNDEYTVIASICWDLAQELLDEGNYYFSTEYLRLGESVDKRLGLNQRKWCQKIAEINEKQMNNRIEKGEFSAAAKFCIDSIDEYKRCKDKDKVKELISIYEVIKSKQTFHEISAPIDLSEHAKNCKEYVNILMKNDAQDIIGFIASDFNALLPDAKYVANRAQRILKEHPLRQLVVTTQIDQDFNPSRTFSSEDEKMKEMFLTQYRIELECNQRILIRELIFAGLNEKKINSANITEFLEHNSWIGSEFTKTFANGREVQYSWLDLIKPALDEYYLQLENKLDNAESKVHFILCMDSLAIKLEGLVRHFLAVNNVAITTPKKEGKPQLRLIEDLLREEKLGGFFSDSELAFFRFVLTKDGYDVRNMVAHARFIPQQYSIDLMNYLLIILLRIGKYQLTIRG